ncbi:MAG: FMN-binding negative transcriptional regulator [Blastomonas sp.]|nr:FMN-binding negative transcriptional regulator [Blastomonas sp.]
MYSPPAFREQRIDVLREAIRSHPLATLITSGSAGLIANVLPFSLRTGAEGDVLCAHLAKANEQIVDLRAGEHALVMFQGPQAYVSPSWYRTKKQHGKVVPTWNYIVVQARGLPKVLDDRSWLLNQLSELTSTHEANRVDPWHVDDAPSDFIDGLLTGIVGLEIPIERMEGKWKVSQNQPLENSLSVAEGLQADGARALAAEVIARARGS